MGSIKKSPYQILRRPLITEKGAQLSALANSSVFEVHKSANKLEIRDAVEKIFKVKVKSVRTMNMKGKERRVGKRVGRQPDWKKAYVVLEQGSSIDLVEGL